MVFQTTDPRGFIISCSKSTYNTHISTGHTIMKDNLNAVKETIENPDIIYISDQSPVRHIYFSVVDTSTYVPLYTKVVTEIDESTKTGEVVSAWPQKNISGGILEGGILYVKPKL